MGRDVTTVINSGLLKAEAPWGAGHGSAICLGVTLAGIQETAKQAQLEDGTDMLRLTHDCTKNLLWAFPGLNDE